MPLIGAVGAGTAHADDCHQPYGAIQGGSDRDANCERVGTHLRLRHHHDGDHHGDHARTYTVASTVGTASATDFPGADNLYHTGTTNVLYVVCDNAALTSATGATSGADSADTATAPVVTGATGIASLTAPSGIVDSTGRNVGFFVTYQDGDAATANSNPLALSATCVDDHAPAHVAA
jgi:hypothetical protein